MKSLVLSTLLVLEVLLVGTVALAVPVTDRIRIEAMLSQLPPGVAESAAFNATFPNDPMLLPQVIDLTEPGDMTAASDRLALVVTRPGAAGAGSMDVTLGFVSDPETQPVAGPVRLPETGLPM